MADADVTMTGDIAKSDSTDQTGCTSSASWHFEWGARGPAVHHAIGARGSGLVLRGVVDRERTRAVGY
jgi:hypothetical protein